MRVTASVVLPAYNGERFLRPAIDSVLAQTLTDFELIVVDDGSSDRTPEILAEYAAKDSRVRVHRHPVNLGFRQALNTACRLAQGEVIATMGHDDISLPRRLERQVNFFARCPTVGAVGSSVQVIDELGNPQQVKQYPENPALVAWSMLFFSAIAHPAMTVRRDCLNLDEAYPAGCLGGTEDYAVASRMSLTAGLANIDEVLVLYRSWPGNMTSTRWAAQEEGAVRIAGSLAASVGLKLTSDEISVLRGLATDNYPTAADVLALAIDNVDAWTHAVLSCPQWSAGDRETVKTAAAARLLQIAALIARRRPAFAARTAARAVELSPASIVTFIRKAAKRVR